MKRKYLLLGMLALSSQIFSQGLFESTGSADSETSIENSLNIDLGGYTRGVLYVGEVTPGGKQGVKSSYGEVALKLNASKGDVAEFVSELRFRDGFEYGERISQFDLREGYVKTSFGKLDFRFGKQIVAWGKADGFNPTDNITPQNGVVRSPESDDIRIGNTLLRSFYNISPKWQLEGIWVPKYRNSAMPFYVLEWPEGSFVGEDIYPEENLENSSYAFRLKFQGAAIDASVSFFEGYNCLPGMAVSRFYMDPDDYSTEIDISAVAYKNEIIGADFSTSIGSWGLRGEAAYRKIDKRDEGKYYVPMDDLYYVAGIDRTWGDFSLLAQYIGRYVLDFEKLVQPDPYTDGPQAVAEYNMALVNRAYFMQRDEISHAASIRPAMNFLYDNLTAEVVASYNFTTEEYMLRPMITYNINDGVQVIAGGEYFKGDEGSLYKLISPIFNGGFISLKYTF
ncbi:hypothetical protein E9993_00025 [Labilibacter sediminis]|nr:hypothetical protein E9993_00025 [Labilibacter sediminis]